MKEMRIDFESRSDADLQGKKTGPKGAGRYFASPHFKALMAAYAIDDGPIKTWTYDQPCPTDLREHVENGGCIRAFNASFERQCFEQLHIREGWPLPAIDRYRCTATEAAAMGLPRSLAAVSEALGLPIGKDKRGEALIRKFSIPRPTGAMWNEPEDHPVEFAEFLAYCVRDVEVEAAVAKRVFPLSEYERQVYTLDQEINARGIRIDRRSAKSAIRLVEKALILLDAEMRAVTGDAVRKCSDVSRLTAWIQNRGIELSSAVKAELTDLLLTEDLPADVRRAVEIRQEGGKISVKKLQAMLDRANEDGRVRDAFLYHKASTGRWQSVGVNFNNMPRPRREYDEAHLDASQLFNAFRKEDPELLSFLYGEQLGRPLHLVSDATRGFIWAAPGHDLMQADYSGIEGAVIAWSSDEAWKVQAMHEINADPKNVPDMYRRTAASIMNTTTDVIHKKHPLRQSVGKVAELALGFGGGVPAFYSMSRNYGVNLDPLYTPVWGAASEEIRAKAVKRYENSLRRGKDRTDELSREAWLACEIIKVGWRASNPAITNGWNLREAHVREAIRNPGTKTHALKFSYLVAHGFLWCQLPSGRCLAYGAPKLKDQVWAKFKFSDGSWSDAEVLDREYAEKLELDGKVKIEGASSQAISALGVHKNGRLMQREALYNGKFAENDTQAVARDLLVNGMFKAEHAGYPIVAHVYDEIICEVPRGFGSLSDFERMICELPPWAVGLPLIAGGWRGKRYRKD